MKRVVFFLAVLAIVLTGCFDNKISEGEAIKIVKQKDPSVTYERKFDATYIKNFNEGHRPREIQARCDKKELLCDMHGAVWIVTEFLPDHKRHYYLEAKTGKMFYEYDELNEGVVPGKD
ncbi:hypothetical protein LJR153_003444 [Paenibacillus sp. LjRoot153]|uniref:hypothetical protein n=1 Tax=Paenibacillus sp. LjRoot153 TaxID=3342270 RepID=UPI003ECDD2DB